MKQILTILFIFILHSCQKHSNISHQIKASSCVQSNIKSFSLAVDNTSFWEKSTNWTNGGQFLSGWRSDHVLFNSSIMELIIDNSFCPSGCSNKSFASGEYRSKNFYQYGRFEVDILASNKVGTVTSLFTYTGAKDGNQHDEIDIEILGGDITNIHFNYWLNGIQHPVVVALNFDASITYHHYAFEWNSSSIKWYVDNILKHSVSTNIPNIAEKIIMNYWPVSGWTAAGVYNYTSQTKASYKNFKYTPSECIN